MSRHEAETGDLLWKYIAELHRVGGSDQVNFIARTSVDPVEMAALLPLADALHAELTQPADTVAGEAVARAQLLAAIQAPSSSGPRILSALQRRALPPLAFTAAQIRDFVTILCLIAGIGAAIWFVNLQNRGPAYVAPAEGFGPPEGAHCDVKAK